MGRSVLEYYSQRNVAEEIAEFLRGRWAALEGPGKRWVRWRKDKPFTVHNWRDVVLAIREYSALGVRTWYGTIEVYKQLNARRDVEELYELNISRVTPFIDIDIVDDDIIGKAWPCALKAARIIVEWLEDQGVVGSVYLLWSGAGVHVRINENAFSNVLSHAHPLDVTFAVVEYALEATQHQLLEVIRECKGLIKVENLIAPKRVFTAPLSLHRSLDRVAVAFKPNELEDFTLEWSNPDNPNHNPSAWKSFRRGEADELAFRALQRVGKVKSRKLMSARATKLYVPSPAPEQTPPHPTLEALSLGELREPGRFPVMGLLQAARYYMMRGDLEKAKSWGLNRAIFYAWAKYYGPHRRPIALQREARRYALQRQVPDSELKWDEVGGEKAQVSPRGWYVIGGVEQRPEDFDRNIARKFEEAGIKFDDAWHAALEYLKKFPRSVLSDPQKFYKEVYEPVRDRFIEKVLKKYTRTSASRESKEGESKGTLDKWLRPRKT